MPASWRLPRGAVADVIAFKTSSIAAFCVGVMGISVDFQRARGLAMNATVQVIVVVC